MQPGNHSSVALIQKAVVRHIGNARRKLHQSLDDDAIHGARKDLKRARTGLRLLRPLDERAYHRENLRLRDIGRRLSAVRDGKVLLARTATLLEQEKKPQRRELIVALRRELHKTRRRDWRMLQSNGHLERIEDSLAAAARHLRHWPIPEDADTLSALAVRRLYRKGRKAFAQSCKDPSDERLHEMRKQAKHLAQALELLAGKKPPKKAKKLLYRADHIGDWLGDDHDFAVVESRLMAEPKANAKAKRKLGALIEKRRLRLQKKALKAGEKLFRKKTRRALVRAAIKPPAL